MDKKLYEEIYRKKLYCNTEECNAKLKFTERKNGKRFYSTWNKQGTAHIEGCPYYLRIKGQVSRRRVVNIDIYEPATDEHIERTILNMSRSLKENKDSGTPVGQLTTRETINEDDIGYNTTVKDDGTSAESGILGERIYGLDARYASPAFIGDRRCVYGEINNAYFDETDGYAYLNFENEHHNFSAYYPQAFYNDTNITNINTLKLFIDTLNKEINGGKKLILICAGFIKPKKKENGLNIHILHPKHFVVNGAKYNDITISNSIPECQYDY